MVLDSFLRYLQFEKRFSAHTLAAYASDLGEFKNFISEHELEAADVKPVHIRSWMVELMDKGLQARSVNRKLSALRSYFRFLLKQGQIPRNPMLQVKGPKTGKKLPEVFQADKLAVLLDQMEAEPQHFDQLRDSLVIELLFGTGIRVSELVGLKTTDVDLHAGTIRVMGKRRKERLVPLNRSLQELIRKYLAERHPADAEMFILTKEGKPAYSRMIHRLVTGHLAQLTSGKRNPHMLRHTFATTLLDKGADLNAIKELLGHASLAATQVYTHNSVERLKSIYKQAHPKA